MSITTKKKKNKKKLTRQDICYGSGSVTSAHACSSHMESRGCLLDVSVRHKGNEASVP
jgi:hypothetical protein